MRGIKKFGAVDYFIAVKLKKFRTEQGYSLEEMGELVGVSFQQVQKYEKPETRIGAAKLFEFAHALNQPVSAFFDGVKVKGKYYDFKVKTEKRRVKESEEANKDLLPLIRAFNMIENKQTKRHIVNLVCEIAGPFYRKRVKHEYS